MDDHVEEAKNEFTAEQISSRHRDAHCFDGWGEDGVNVYFAPQEADEGRLSESVILITGGIFTSSNGTIVVRVEDTELGMEQDPEDLDLEISHASCVLRFTEIEYQGSGRGEHRFSGLLAEALAYGKDVQRDLDYGNPLEDILYSEGDCVPLDPPDAGVLTHLVGRRAGMLLSRDLGFRSDRYEPRRSEEADRIFIEESDAYWEQYLLERGEGQ